MGIVSAGTVVVLSDEANQIGIVDGELADEIVTTADIDPGSGMVPRGVVTVMRYKQRDQ